MLEYCALRIASDKKSITIERQIPLTDFAPAMMATVAGKLVIPRSDKNEIAVIDETATAVVPADIKPATFHRQFSFTFAKHWYDKIVFLGDSRGTLVAYSIDEGYFPFPFVEPIIINPQVAESVGVRPQTIYFRHQEQNFDIAQKSPRGFSAWIVSDTQWKIFPMDFLEVFGP